MNLSKQKDNMNLPYVKVDLRFLSNTSPAKYPNRDIKGKEKCQVQSTFQPECQNKISENLFQTNFQDHLDFPKYSQTCLRQPLFGPLKSGHLGQVIVL